jgi:hypothetical protein
MIITTILLLLYIIIKYKDEILINKYKYEINNNKISINKYKDELNIKEILISKYLDEINEKQNIILYYENIINEIVSINAINNIKLNENEIKISEYINKINNLNNIKLLIKKILLINNGELYQDIDGRESHIHFHKLNSKLLNYKNLLNELLY